MEAQAGAGRGWGWDEECQGQIAGSTEASLAGLAQERTLPAPQGRSERQRKAHVRMDLAPFARGKVGGFAAWETGFEPVLPGILHAPLPLGARVPE